jgi:nitrate reductase gamma subunit
VFVAALREIIRRLWPQAAYKNRTMFALINGYVMHVGLALCVFFLMPHILFIKDLFGISWPGLPNNAIYFVGVITVAVGLALLIRRMTHPVLKLISNFDDYFSWLVTMLPVVTGLIMPIRFGVRYETLLAIHILSVALLLVWLPFSKLAHTYFVFISRGTTGAILVRRGAKT